jgi:hypothetical protein
MNRTWVVNRIVPPYSRQLSLLLTTGIVLIDGWVVESGAYWARVGYTLMRFFVSCEQRMICLFQSANISSKAS